MLAAFITALAGPELTPAEAAVLRAARPCGIILFARNVRDPEQVRRLTEAARAAVGDDILVLIDQEGGRVRRLQPPHWRELPAGRCLWPPLCATIPPRPAAAARLAARLTAAELRAVGINTNCAPVLDVPVPGSHDIIGDRAYGAEPAAGVRPRARGGRGVHGRRRAAGDQAHARARPRDQGQPSGAAGRVGLARPSSSAPTSPRSGAWRTCRRR